MATKRLATDKRRLMVATRELRHRLNLHQPEFGQKIGRSLGSVVRYESKHPPTGRALYELRQLAANHGHTDLALIFDRGLSEDPMIYDETFITEGRLNRSWADVEATLRITQLETDNWTAAECALALALVDLSREARSSPEKKALDRLSRMEDVQARQELARIKLIGGIVPK